MFVCKNCGGNIIYDIKAKALVCTVCKSSFAPESVTKENDSVDYDFFETTIFTCPQCGAQIMCEENEASSFCTYCSSSTVLTSRISKEKKPDYIIPFEKTKAECIDEFKKVSKRAVFAPSELKDQKILDKFKAIYVPYWYYNVKQENGFTFTGVEKSSTAYSDTIYTAFYDITGRIDAEYDGICKDASYNFSDDLCERIAPFFTSEKKKFYPSYLSGFYADVTDVPAVVYEHEARDIANNLSKEVIRDTAADEEFKRIQLVFSADEDTDKQLNTVITAKRALLPVWFMSFKSGKKVAYMTVNGQTGRAASDFPISKKKYIAASLILAALFTAPFAFILSAFKQSSAFAFLDVALIISIVMYVYYFIDMKTMQIRDEDSEDAGKFHRKTGVVYIRKNKKENMEKTKRDIKGLFATGDLSEIILGIIYIIIILVSIFKFDLRIYDIAFKLILTFGNAVLAVMGFIRGGKIVNSAKYYGIFAGMISLVIVAGILLAAPQIAFLNMLAGACLIAGSFFTCMDLINYHNELTTRQPPHLKRRGGYEIADSYNL